jgi:hypothetical protein
MPYPKSLNTHRMPVSRHTNDACSIITVTQIPGQVPKETHQLPSQSKELGLFISWNPSTFL